MEFALSPEGQATGAAAGQNQVPSNARATLPLTAPDISMIKMVDYDFATFGQPEERSRLLSRFDSEIHLDPDPVGPKPTSQKTARAPQSAATGSAMSARGPRIQTQATGG